MRLLAAVALVAALVAAGCALPAGVEESAQPCGARAGAPGSPYEALELRAQTRVRGSDLHEAELREMLRLVSARIITPAATPYLALDATLTEVGPPDAELSEWRFEANGTWRDGAIEGADVYDLGLWRRGSVVGADFAADAVDAPAFLRAKAMALAPVPGEPVEARWFADAPSCVRLAYGEGAEHVWVDLARNLVVSAPAS